MALITLNFFSTSLMRTVPVNVILPVDKQEAAVEAEAAGGLAGPHVPEGGFKTLYLLHGIFGNYTDWVSGTCIQRWAEERDLAVVMPSGDNRFYVDQEASHDRYGRFIGEELVAMTRAMFPLSARREDTFVGGLSMGGYGALVAGLAHPGTFGRIISLSGALSVDGFARRTDDTARFFESKRFTEAIFGDATQVAGSDRDPAWLAERLASSGSALPRIFLACGTDDRLLEVNRSARDRLSALGYEVAYEEGPGGHNWDFWNRTIEHAIAWLPLGKPTPGTNSGNVGI